MGIENLNQSETDRGGAAAGDDNLQDALSGGDEGYVTEGEGSKKPSPIVTLGLALAVVGGGYLWWSRGGPAGADAATPTEDPASQTVTKFLDGGTANVQMMEKMLRDTEKVVQQFLNYPSMKQVPLGELQTNPFRFRALPVEGQLPNAGDAAAKKKREEERQAVIKAVSTLNLQSVIHSGVRKSCMIDNTLYTEGQQVGAGEDPTSLFIIEKIQPGSVIVKNGVYRFELKMQK
jgi:hypothetical protein